MTMIAQIFWGSMLLLVCSLAHIVVLVNLARFIRHHNHRLKHLRYISQWSILLSTTFLVVVLAHTLQVWGWATAFYSLGALADMNNCIYFSLVTYTTVGYGDVIVDSNFRIFAAMTSVTGLLNFGLSTAFLVGVFTRILEFNTKKSEEP